MQKENETMEDKTFLGIKAVRHVSFGFGVLAVIVKEPAYLGTFLSDSNTFIN